jgi:hypothetical protein
MSAEIVGFDPATGMLSLPWWAASIATAVVVACLVAAVVRGGIVRMAAALGAVALVVIAAAAAWNWAARLGDDRGSSASRGLEARLFELSRSATLPGSPLGCLDGLVGETVESACEKSLFASADTVASATAYMAEKLALFALATEATAGRLETRSGVVMATRRSLEADRFGFVAQVLASLYGCTAEKCEAFRLFTDATRLRANLKDAAFDGFVGRNAAAWPARPVRPAMTAGPPPAGASPVPPGFTVPSAASIPPVSIMNPEPGPAAASPPAAAEASPPPAAAAPPRRPARTSPRANAPVSIVPPGATAGSAAGQ